MAVAAEAIIKRESTRAGFTQRGKVSWFNVRRTAQCDGFGWYPAFISLN